MSRITNVTELREVILEELRGGKYRSAAFVSVPYDFDYNDVRDEMERMCSEGLLEANPHAAIFRLSQSTGYSNENRH